MNPCAIHREHVRARRQEHDCAVDMMHANIEPIAKCRGHLALNLGPRPGFRVLELRVRSASISGVVVHARSFAQEGASVGEQRLGGRASTNDTATAVKRHAERRRSEDGRLRPEAASVTGPFGTAGNKGNARRE